MTKCPKLENGTYVFGDGASDFAAVMATLFSIGGVCLNLLVIVSLINYRRTRRHVTTPFIVTLSVLDLVYAGFILPVYAARFANRESPLGDGFCAFFPVIFYCTMGASVLTLTMVTVNRACMLYFPNKVDKIFTNNKEIRGHNVPVNSLIILFICLLFPSFLVLPSYFQDLTGLNQNTASCTLQPLARGQRNMIYIIGFFVPSVGLLLSDVAIYIKLKEMQRLDCRNSLATVDEKRMEKMFMLMLFIIWVLFIVTFAPSLLMKMADKCYSKPTLHILAYTINWATVVINPIVYVVSQKKYKDAIIFLRDNIQTCTASKKPSDLKPIRLDNIPAINSMSEDKPGNDEEFQMRPMTMTALNNKYLDSVCLSTNMDRESRPTSSWVSSGIGSMHEATATS